MTTPRPRLPRCRRSMRIWKTRPRRSSPHLRPVSPLSNPDVQGTISLLFLLTKNSTVWWFQPLIMINFVPCEFSRPIFHFVSLLVFIPLQFCCFVLYHIDQINQNYQNTANQGHTSWSVCSHSVEVSLEISFHCNGRDLFQTFYLGSVGETGNEQSRSIIVKSLN